jgi:hypothetical protein
VTFADVGAYLRIRGNTRSSQQPERLARRLSLWGAQVGAAARKNSEKRHILPRNGLFLHISCVFSAF